MQTISEAEVLIGAAVVGKVPVQNIAALPALRPRIGLVVGVDLGPIHGSLYSRISPPSQYWLTELRGNLYISEEGLSIGSVHWMGSHHSVRSHPHPSESQLQLACDLDMGTLERLEMARGRTRSHTVDRAMAAARAPRWLPLRINPWIQPYRGSRRVDPLSRRCRLRRV